jgi:hypothetical protein
VNDDPDDPAHTGFRALRAWVERTRPRYLLVLVDRAGNSISGHIPTPHATAHIRRRRVVLHGAGFAPDSRVDIEYHGRLLGRGASDRRGRLAAALPAPRSGGA